MDGYTEEQEGDVHAGGGKSVWDRNKMQVICRFYLLGKISLDQKSIYSQWEELFCTFSAHVWTCVRPRLLTKHVRDESITVNSTAAAVPRITFRWSENDYPSAKDGPFGVMPIELLSLPS